MNDNCELEVVFDTCNLSVNIGGSAELDCHAAIQFIESGRREIDEYVTHVILPQLQQSANNNGKEF